jgi:microcystin-dependent protein
MAQPYVGEIRMFGGNFPPVGWLFCDGQLLPISENETLFQLIGTTFGGDGQENFGIPNLQSRLPVHMGQGPGLSNRILAETGGTESVTLTTQQIPSHNHAFVASLDGGTAITPKDNVLGAGASASIYRPAPANLPMNAGSIGATGGSQPHDNMHPYLCIDYIISLFGIFPSPT